MTKPTGAQSPSISEEPSPRIRHMTASDLENVLDIQRACYAPAMNESGDIFLNRLECASEHAWVALLDGEPEAYLMTYPSRVGKITPLGGEFEPPAHPDCLYIHDLAVHPEASGQGLGRALLRHALAASCFRMAALVCVQDARRFWEQNGFSEGLPLSAVEADHLATYPGQPRYMLRHTT